MILIFPFVDCFSLPCPDRRGLGKVGYPFAAVLREISPAVTWKKFGKPPIARMSRIDLKDQKSEVRVSREPLWSAATWRRFLD